MLVFGFNFTVGTSVRWIADTGTHGTWMFELDGWVAQSSSGNEIEPIAVTTAH